MMKDTQFWNLYHTDDEVARETYLFLIISGNPELHYGRKHFLSSMLYNSSLHSHLYDWTASPEMYVKREHFELCDMWEGLTFSGIEGHATSASLSLAELYASLMANVNHVHLKVECVLAFGDHYITSKLCFPRTTT